MPDLSLRDESEAMQDVGVDSWPGSTRETIFPLQARSRDDAMIRDTFLGIGQINPGWWNSMVAITTSSQASCRDQCANAGLRASLSGEIYITPCGGTKNVQCASFLGFISANRSARLILLDGDDGRPSAP